MNIVRMPFEWRVVNGIGDDTCSESPLNLSFYVKLLMECPEGKGTAVQNTTTVDYT